MPGKGDRHVYFMMPADNRAKLNVPVPFIGHGRPPLFVAWMPETVRQGAKVLDNERCCWASERIDWAVLEDVVMSGLILVAGKRQGTLEPELRLLDHCSGEALNGNGVSFLPGQRAKNRQVARCPFSYNVLLNRKLRRRNG